MTVSICCITYNHASYIRQCLESFIMQKTDFNFEILINDDASTDSTQDIIKEYQEKYPDIIKPIFQTENQYSQGVRPINKFNWNRAEGKYIAMCEGDDYWTNPLKLQKQVDFLEENQEYIACGCYVDTERYGTLQERRPPFLERDYEAVDLISKHPFPTLTTLFRKVDFTAFYNYKVIVGDIELFMFLSQYGKFKRLPFKGGVYRFHGKGANSGNSHYENRKKNTIAKIKFNQKFNIYPKSLYKSRLKMLIKKEIIIITKDILKGRKGIKESIHFINFCLIQYKSLNNSSK